MKGNPETALPVFQGERKREKVIGGWGGEETCVLHPGEVIENANSVPIVYNFEGQVLVIGLLKKQPSRNKNRSLTKNITFQLRRFKVLLPISLFKKLETSLFFFILRTLEMDVYVIEEQKYCGSQFKKC